MFRTVITLALSLFLVAEAGAQTLPVAPAKSAKATARSSRRAAKKARRLAVKSAPTLPRVNNGWPALDEAQPAVAAATPVVPAGAYGASSAGAGGELDNANVYAAPGMPVHMRTSNGMTPYSVRPARKPAAQTTLSTRN